MTRRNAFTTRYETLVDLLPAPATRQPPKPISEQGVTVRPQVPTGGGKIATTREYALVTIAANAASHGFSPRARRVATERYFS